MLRQLARKVGEIIQVCVIQRTEDSGLEVGERLSIRDRQREYAWRLGYFRRFDVCANATKLLRLSSSSAAAR
jgi:hypothetical protein